MSLRSGWRQKWQHRHGSPAGHVPDGLHSGVRSDYKWTHILPAPDVNPDSGRVMRCARWLQRGDMAVSF